MFSSPPPVGDTDSGDFVCFVGELKKEMDNNSRYVKEISSSDSTTTVQSYKTSWGLLCLSLHSVPSISICCRVLPQRTCRFYALELTKDILKEHMEEDLELFNDNGLEGFGCLLGAALKQPLAAQHDSAEQGAAYFPLHLAYSIGNNELVGILKIPLVEDNISEAVIGFMFDIKESSVSSADSYGSAGSSGHKRSRDNMTSSQLQCTSMSSGDGALQSLAEASQDDSSASAAPTPAAAVVKPKQKKRVGGISLNPSTRKKK